jgi:hypothetical protein
MLPVLNNGPYHMVWDDIHDRNVGDLNAMNVLSSFYRSDSGDVMQPDIDCEDEFPFVTEMRSDPGNVYLSRQHINTIIKDLDQRVPAGGRHIFEDPTRRLVVKNNSGYRLRQVEKPDVLESKITNPGWRKLVKQGLLKHSFEWDFEIKNRPAWPAEQDQIRFATLHRRSAPGWGGKIQYEVGVGYRVTDVFLAEEKIFFNEKFNGICEVRYRFEFAKLDALASTLGLTGASAAEVALALSYAIYIAFSESRIVKINGFDATTDEKNWHPLKAQPEMGIFAYSPNFTLPEQGRFMMRSDDFRWKRIIPKPAISRPESSPRPWVKRPFAAKIFPVLSSIASCCR